MWIIGAIVVLILLIITLSWTKVMKWSNPFKTEGYESPHHTSPAPNLYSDDPSKHIRMQTPYKYSPQ